ncbi:hypothetical protein CERSUDRAFT_90185 [Gelatoporia subvermispora B]|uniref:DUF6535 domain-containing protein n=1 Tax=Ceriporiopsis subvermispora (strain B) TaxID=914234 RepID=M2RRT7_CERS8|nr:hypothetical protein CERSUDRAFT_90185 [Gelatoporia subvermispora B]
MSQAGLFSAALTAFNVELYTALKPDGNEAPPTSSVWINALWFSSLILSLSSASIGIIVRQWLHQFISPASPDPRRSAEIHHSRYELGIIRWKVPEILNILPILLLAALMLFFIGLAILLSTLNFAVAILCTAMISILFIFFAVTTIAPTFWFDCPYKSPQALMAYWFLQYVYGSFIVRLLRAFLHQAYSNLKPKKQNRGNITRKPERFPKICRDLIALCSKLRVLLIHYVEQHSHHNDICDNWKALEQSALERHSSHQRESEAKSAGSVTADVLTSASAALIDDTFLSEVIHPCILDPSCEIDDASLILQRVAKAIPVASFSGSEFSTLALAHHTRVAAEQSHRDIPQFRLLQMQYYYRSNEEAKAALINWANTACDTRLAVGAIVQLMTEYMIEPFRDDRLALPHDSGFLLFTLSPVD